MVKVDPQVVFESLSAKQHETLGLACRHLTSKQIAVQLGVAPITIDKRIDVVRAKLGGIPRTDLLRLYGDWSGDYDQTIGGLSLLPDPARSPDYSGLQSDGPAFVFEDSLQLDARTSWDGRPIWLQPGLKPSDLGVGGKLLAMLIGAVAIMMAAVLLMAFADALMSMLMR